MLIPAKTLSVVPNLPGSWRELSIDHLRVGSYQIAVSVRRAGINYVTTVSAPVGWNLTIGYTLPANTQVKSVRLNRSPAAFQIVPTATEAKRSTYKQTPVARRRFGFRLNDAALPNLRDSTENAPHTGAFANLLLPAIGRKALLSAARNLESRACWVLSQRPSCSPY